MKNLRFKVLNIRHYFYVLLLAFISAGCDSATNGDYPYNKETQYSTREYKNFGEMLTKCDSVTIVVATGINEGNIKAARHLVTVIDINGEAFTYAGGKLDLQKGDTVKWVGNCH